MMTMHGGLGSSDGIIDYYGNFIWDRGDKLLQGDTSVVLYYYVKWKKTTSEFENILLSHLQNREPVIVGLTKNGATHYVLCVGFRKNPADNYSYYYYILDPDRGLSNFTYDGYSVLGSYIVRGWDIMALAAFKSN